MSKITKYALSDLYDMSSGLSSKKEQAGHGAPFVSFGTVYNNYFLPEELPDLMDTNEKEQQIYSIKTGDVLITRTSETIDELAMSCVAVKDYPKATYSGFTKRLRPKREGIAYPKYMAFYFRSALFRKAVTNNAFMTLRASFNEDIFTFLDVYLPDYDEQVRIGDMLYNIECKIQKNKEINDYLEEMAKTIYDYWFVQFDFPDENGKPYKSSGGKMVWNDKLNLQIPNTWQSTELSSYGKIISGGTPSTENEDFYADDGIAWITPNDLSNNTSNMFISHGERDISLQGLNNSSANLIPSSSILLSTRAPIGYIAVSMNELTTNQGFKTLVPNDTDNTSFLYYLIKRNIPYLEQMGTGTTFKEVSKDSMEHLTVILPSDNILAHFFQKIKPYIMLRKSYEQETKKLISIRNWLLPIVMNGQATIED
ncbi:restriction endonuclease subunit S [Coprococcus comes]|uniref:restriction endonuclease subunit S n=1 Tax=Coprococcus comes TaxID=410072 RepID=UPI0032C11550